MNIEERQDLKVVIQKLEQAAKERQNMADDISNIKENLFNPHTGLWAETTKNSEFRESNKNISIDVTKNTDFREGTTKWRTVVGVGVFGLVMKQIWEYITSLGHPQ